MRLLLLRSLPALFCCCLMLLANTAVADDKSPADFPMPLQRLDHTPPPQQDKDWKITLGGGLMYAPAFIGSKDYQLSAFPDIRIEYKDRFFASPFSGIGYHILKEKDLRLGAIIKYDGGREEDGESLFRLAGTETKALKGLGDVDGTFEVGGFFEYDFLPSLTYSLELRQGLGGHEGFIGETGLTYKDRTTLFDQTLIYGFGPQTTFGDANYNQTYFGITPQQSARSGLRPYEADFGIVSYGLKGFVAVPVSKDIAVNLFAGYDRLGTEAGNSPLIQQRGDKNQFMGGLRLTYEWGY